MRSHSQVLLVFILLATGIVASTKVGEVSAAGVLYASPSEVPVQPLNSNFSIYIKVSSMSQFNGWDIQIQSDPGVVDAINFTISGGVFGGGGNELVHCVDGVGHGCCLTNSCTPQDGVGIVRSAVYSVSPTYGNGLLFNITYHVVSSKPYTPLNIQNDQIAGGASGAVDHTTVNAYYGTGLDFSLGSSPSSLNVAFGSSNMSTIGLSSLDGFGGQVNLTALPPGNGILATLSSSQLVVSVGGSATSTLMVQVPDKVSATSYSVIVTARSKTSATSAIISHLITVSVIARNPDFVLGANPADLLTDQSSSNQTTVTIKSLYGFNGAVTLQLTAPSVTRASLDQTTFDIPKGGVAETTLRISTQASFTRFRDEFSLTATNGTITHGYVVVAEPPGGDFALSSSQVSVGVQAGGSQSLTIKVASLHYYDSEIYILGASQSGVGLSFNPTSIYLNYSQTVSSALSITTDSGTSPGNHTITLTAVGRQFGNPTLSAYHSIEVTVIVSAPQLVEQVRTFLGLQAPLFYGILAGLGLALAVLGIYETRRSRPSKRRAILED